MDCIDIQTENPDQQNQAKIIPLQLNSHKQKGKKKNKITHKGLKEDQNTKADAKQDKDLLADKIFNNHLKNIINQNKDIRNSSNKTLRQIINENKQQSYKNHPLQALNHKSTVSKLNVYKGGIYDSSQAYLSEQYISKLPVMQALRSNESVFYTPNLFNQNHQGQDQKFKRLIQQVIQNRSIGKLHSIIGDDAKTQIEKQAQISIVMHPIIPFQKSEQSLQNLEFANTAYGEGIIEQIMSQNVKIENHQANEDVSQTYTTKKMNIQSQAMNSINAVKKLKGIESQRQKDSIINLKSENAYFDSPSGYGINTPKQPFLDKMTFNNAGSNYIQTLMNNSNNQTQKPSCEDHYLNSVRMLDLGNKKSSIDSLIQNIEEQQKNDYLETRLSKQEKTEIRAIESKNESKTSKYDFANRANFNVSQNPECYVKIIATDSRHEERNKQRILQSNVSFNQMITENHQTQIQNEQDVKSKLQLYIQAFESNNLNGHSELSNKGILGFYNDIYNLQKFQSMKNSPYFGQSFISNTININQQNLLSDTNKERSQSATKYINFNNSSKLSPRSHSNSCSKKSKSTVQRQQILESFKSFVNIQNRNAFASQNSKDELGVFGLGQNSYIEEQLHEKKKFKELNERQKKIERMIKFKNTNQINMNRPESSFNMRTKKDMELYQSLFQGKNDKTGRFGSFSGPFTWNCSQADGKTEVLSDGNGENKFINEHNKSKYLNEQSMDYSNKNSKVAQGQDLANNINYLQEMYKKHNFHEKKRFQAQNQSVESVLKQKKSLKNFYNQDIIPVDTSTQKSKRNFFSQRQARNSIDQGQKQSTIQQAHNNSHRQVLNRYKQSTNQNNSIEQLKSPRFLQGEKKIKNSEKLNSIQSSVEGKIQVILEKDATKTVDNTILIQQKNYTSQEDQQRFQSNEEKQTRTNVNTKSADNNIYNSREVNTQQPLKAEIEKNGDSEISMNSLSIFRPVIVQNEKIENVYNHRQDNSLVRKVVSEKQLCDDYKLIQLNDKHILKNQLKIADETQKKEENVKIIQFKGKMSTNSPSEPEKIQALMNQFQTFYENRRNLSAYQLSSSQNKSQSEYNPCLNQEQQNFFKEINEFQDAINENVNNFKDNSTNRKKIQSLQREQERIMLQVQEDQSLQKFLGRFRGCKLVKNGQQNRPSKNQFEGLESGMKIQEKMSENKRYGNQSKIDRSKQQNFKINRQAFSSGVQTTSNNHKLNPIIINTKDSLVNDIMQQMNQRTVKILQRPQTGGQHRILDSRIQKRKSGKRSDYQSQKIIFSHLQQEVKHQQNPIDQEVKLNKEIVNIETLERQKTEQDIQIKIDNQQDIVSQDDQPQLYQKFGQKNKRILREFKLQGLKKKQKHNKIIHPKFDEGKTKVIVSKVKAEDIPPSNVYQSNAFRQKYTQGVNMNNMINNQAIEIYSLLNTNIQSSTDNQIESPLQENSGPYTNVQNISGGQDNSRNENKDNMMNMLILTHNTNNTNKSQLVKSGNKNKIITPTSSTINKMFSKMGNFALKSKPETFKSTQYGVEKDNMRNTQISAIFNQSNHQVNRYESSKTLNKKNQNSSQTNSKQFQSNLNSLYMNNSLSIKQLKIEELTNQQMGKQLRNIIDKRKSLTGKNQLNQDFSAALDSDERLSQILDASLIEAFEKGEGILPKKSTREFDLHSSLGSYNDRLTSKLDRQKKNLDAVAATKRENKNNQNFEISLSKLKNSLNRSQASLFHNSQYYFKQMPIRQIEFNGPIDKIALKLHKQKLLNLFIEERKRIKSNPLLLQFNSQVRPNSGVINIPPLTRTSSVKHLSNTIKYSITNQMRQRLRYISAEGDRTQKKNRNNQQFLQERSNFATRQTDQGGYLSWQIYKSQFNENQLYSNQIEKINLRNSQSLCNENSNQSSKNQYNQIDYSQREKSLVYNQTHMKNVFEPSLQGIQTSKKSNNTESTQQLKVYENTDNRNQSGLSQMKSFESPNRQERDQSTLRLKFKRGSFDKTKQKSSLKKNSIKNQKEPYKNEQKLFKFNEGSQSLDDLTKTLSPNKHRTENQADNRDMNIKSNDKKGAFQQIIVSSANANSKEGTQNQLSVLISQHDKFHEAQYSLQKSLIDQSVLTPISGSGSIDTNQIQNFQKNFQLIKGGIQLVYHTDTGKIKKDDSKSDKTLIQLQKSNRFKQESVHYSNNYINEQIQNEPKLNYYFIVNSNNTEDYQPDINIQKNIIENIQIIKNKKTQSIIHNPSTDIIKMNENDNLKLSSSTPTDMVPQRRQILSRDRSKHQSFQRSKGEKNRKSSTNSQNTQKNSDGIVLFGHNIGQVKPESQNDQVCVKSRSHSITRSQNRSLGGQSGLRHIYVGQIVRSKPDQSPNDQIGSFNSNEYPEILKSTKIDNQIQDFQGKVNNNFNQNQQIKPSLPVIIGNKIIIQDSLGSNDKKPFDDFSFQNTFRNSQQKNQKTGTSINRSIVSGKNIKNLNVDLEYSDVKNSKSNANSRSRIQILGNGQKPKISEDFKKQQNSNSQQNYLQIEDNFTVPDFKQLAKERIKNTYDFKLKKATLHLQNLKVNKKPTGILQSAKPDFVSSNIKNDKIQNIASQKTFVQKRNFLSSDIKMNN